MLWLRLMGVSSSLRRQVQGRAGQSPLPSVPLSLVGPPVNAYIHGKAEELSQRTMEDGNCLLLLLLFVALFRSAARRAYRART